MATLPKITYQQLERLNRGRFVEVLSEVAGRQLVEHDEIKEEAIKRNFPIDCITCRHGLSHEACNKPNDKFQRCLEDDPANTDRQKGRYSFFYHNHEFGDPVKAEKEMIDKGLRNIVIGYTGEAEVNVKRSIEETYQHLREVAEACGYMVGRTGMTIYVLTDREHSLVYDELGLKSVGRRDGSAIQWRRGD